MTMRLPVLRSLILALLAASTAINYIDRQALSVLLPVLRDELSLTSTSYGNIVTAFLVAYTVSQLFSGLLLDRFGTRRGMAWAVVIWALAGIGHAFARGAQSLGVLRFVLGLGEAANWPGGGKAIAEWFPKHRRAFAMGCFDGGSALGAIAAPPMVSLIALHWGWREAFVVTGLLGIVWCVAWLLIYDLPDRHRWLSAADRTLAISETGSPRPSRGTLATFASLLRESRLWGLMATRFASSPVWWFYVFWLPDYLAKGRGLTLAEIGLFGWVPYLTVDLGKIIGGALSDRLIARGVSGLAARKAIMAVGAVGMAAGAFVVQADNVATAIAWVCLATFGFGFWSANILALHADFFESARMGTALGLTGTAASIGGSISAFLIGRAIDGHGYGPVFLAAGLLPLLAGVILFVGVRKSPSSAA